MKNCSECRKEILQEGCDKTVNQKNDISATLNEKKRQPPNEFGHMPPKYIITYSYLLSYKWL